MGIRDGSRGRKAPDPTPVTVTTGRVAARSELGKLGIDASDRARFQRAVQSDDEDLVALFVEAGAIDIKSRDSDGKMMMDYATKPVIRELLAFEQP